MEQGDCFDFIFDAWEGVLEIHSGDMILRISGRDLDALEEELKFHRRENDE